MNITSASLVSYKFPRTHTPLLHHWHARTHARTREVTDVTQWHRLLSTGTGLPSTRAGTLPSSPAFVAAAATTTISGGVQEIESNRWQLVVGAAAFAATVAAYAATSGPLGLGSKRETEAGRSDWVGPNQSSQAWPQGGGGQTGGPFGTPLRDRVRGMLPALLSPEAKPPLPA